VEQEAAPEETEPEHRIVPPEVKVTEPVAPEGRPVAASKTEVP
jgi:hypothetical protein